MDGVHLWLRDFRCSGRHLIYLTFLYPINSLILSIFSDTFFRRIWKSSGGIALIRSIVLLATVIDTTSTYAKPVCAKSSCCRLLFWKSELVSGVVTSTLVEVRVVVAVAFHPVKRSSILNLLHHQGVGVELRHLTFELFTLRFLFVRTVANLFDQNRRRH